MQKKRIESYKSLEQINNALNRQGSFQQSILRCALRYKLEIAYPPPVKANVNPPDSELSRLKDKNKNWKKGDLNSEQGVTRRRNRLHYNGDLETSRHCIYCNHATTNYCVTCSTEAPKLNKICIDILMVLQIIIIKPHAGYLPHVSCQNYECWKNLKTCFQKCHDSVRIEQDFSRQRMTSELQKCANKENAMLSAQSRKRKREAMHLEMQQENEELEE